MAKVDSAARQMAPISLLTSHLAGVNAELAELHRKLDLLLQLQREQSAAGRTGSAVSEEEFSATLAAVLQAMGGSVWQAHELLQRALRSDEAGVALAARLARIGGDGGARGIGIFLARRVGGASYVASNGIEIRRCGKDGNRVCWTVSLV